ncbi:hypothetical protein EsDP_00003830 [Epichloe bromicola]|uniref:Uncharacterized protein n=1 Tax=Epichloe bromicola TaxID=79588 RepID=A0ABQ0CPX8_9HYPO
MPPQSTPAAQLPLATNRAALSNQISLLLSRRTALLGSLTAGSRESPATRRVVVPDEDFKATRPNDGVGYAPGASAVDNSKPRDELLRGRILGKRKGGAAQPRVCSVPVRAEGEGEGGSESDDDEGRASVGRAKKARVGGAVIAGWGHGNGGAEEEEEEKGVTS